MEAIVKHPGEYHPSAHPAGTLVTDHVMCNQLPHDGRVDPWIRLRIHSGETVYIFAGSIDPHAVSLKMVAFVKDARPRFMWDHMMTSYKTAEILKGLTCEFPGGHVATSATIVDHTATGEWSYGKQWDGKLPAPPPWKKVDDVPLFQTAAIVTCRIPAALRQPIVAETTAPKLDVKIRLAKRNYDEALPLALCRRTQPKNHVGMCTQPFHKQCTGKCPSAAKQEAGWQKFLGRMEEWLIYGKHIGIDKFYIYDRDGDIDKEPRFKKYLDSGLMVHIHWPVFSDDWAFLPNSIVPGKDFDAQWNNWNKAVSDGYGGLVDRTMKPDRRSPLFEETKGFVFNQGPIYFDQVLAINHCFYTNRYTNSWLASNDADEYWMDPKNPGPGALARWLDKQPADIGEMNAKTVQYGTCPSDVAAVTGNAHCKPFTTIERMQCHDPDPMLTEHMKYAARPTHVRFAFEHYITGFEPHSKGRKFMDPMDEIRVNHYTCGLGRSANYGGCDLTVRDTSMLWSAKAMRATMGLDVCPAFHWP